MSTADLVETGIRQRFRTKRPWKRIVGFFAWFLLIAAIFWAQAVWSVAGRMTAAQLAANRYMVIQKVGWSEGRFWATEFLRDGDKWRQEYRDSQGQIYRATVSDGTTTIELRPNQRWPNGRSGIAEAYVDAAQKQEIPDTPILDQFSPGIPSIRFHQRWRGRFVDEIEVDALQIRGWGLHKTPQCAFLDERTHLPVHAEVGADDPLRRRTWDYVYGPVDEAKLSIESPPGYRTIDVREERKSALNALKPAGMILIGRRRELFVVLPENSVRELDRRTPVDMQGFTRVVSGRPVHVAAFTTKLLGPQRWEVLRVFSASRAWPGLGETRTGDRISGSFGKVHFQGLPVVRVSDGQMVLRPEYLDLPQPATKLTAASALRSG